MSLKKSHIINALVNYAAIAKLFWYLCLGYLYVVNSVWCGEFFWFQFALYLETCNVSQRHYR